ncbi:class I SAM-dependent methyltransferase [Tumidithrix elongata RA019]|uniref:Class I SAM-dependent methyltransferase n=1 Tax=Tumidithrix elongata BACA0141 TaxID=2716417 RepID=A0AAW9Q5Q5_9CYAN|nr:class I SAM-dependent methyltransferase [Tumidithrix elongata RA019]
MTTLSYPYQNSSAGHHHRYLLPPLVTMLSQIQLLHAQPIRVLDLGCGNGSLSNAISQKGFEVVGVEDSESGVAIARQNFPACQFIHASIYDLPYGKLERAFDIAIAAEVIEHLLYPKELLQAAKRCLRSNGRLILTTPYHGYLKNLILAATGKMDSHFTVLWDGGHIKFFSVKTLSALLQQQGFTDLEFRFAGRLPYVWKSMLVSSTPTFLENLD